MDILVVDDEVDICELVSGILSDEGYDVRSVTSGYEALGSMKKRQPSLVLLDVWLGDSSRDGLKILETVRKDHPYVPVVMMSGHGTVETAVSAIKMGAYDFIEKPFQVDRLLLVIKRALEAAKLKRENDELRVRVPSLCSLVGGSHKILDVKQELESAAPTQGRLCIYGPLGCDRVAIARYVHNLSQRADQPFCAVNVLSVGPQNIGVELFGLETVQEDSSTPRKIGLIEKAHGGSCFIDEIGALPQAVQNKLVAFLQHSQFSRVGGSTPVTVDVRLLVGSSQSYEDLLKNEDFSNDLFYRLNTFSVNIPPLIERSRDLALLAKQYLAAISAAQNLPVKSVSESALSLLENYPWPGDIQQLKNVLEWSLIMSSSRSSASIEREDLPPEILQGNEFSKSWNQKSSEMASLPMKEARETFEREYLLAQIKRFQGNITQTAKFIGMDRTALHRKLKQLGVTDEAVA